MSVIPLALQNAWDVLQINLVFDRRALGCDKGSLKWPSDAVAG